MKNLAIILLFISLTSSAQHYPIKNFLGTNLYSWDLVGHYSYSQNITDRKQQALASLKITQIRLSTDVYANKDTDNLVYRLSPEARGFKMDTGIVLLRKLIPNLTVNLCYQNQPKNIQKEYAAVGERSTVYRHQSSDPGLSSSYSELAHDCAVLAARGGTNINAPDYPLYKQLWYEPQQVMYKGQGFYNIIGPENECDNQYSNDKPLNGSQYAAMWAAVYDSVKKIDQNMLVSTTGIANGDPKIMSDAIAWCNLNRGGKLPFDIWEQHHYPWGWPLSGGLPGELSIIPEIQKVKSACPSCLYSVGEWSWDINPHSPINAPAHDGYSAEQSRGQAAVRTIFKFSQIGVHDAYWYRAYSTYDPNIDSSWNQFETSSLLKQTDDSCHWVRHTVGDYFAQISVFGDYSFSKVLRDDSVQVLKFTKQGGADLYVMWTVERITKYTDSKGVTHPVWNERKYNYQFNASGIRYDLNDDSSGVLKQQPYYPGTVELSSKPLFITTFTILPVQDTTSKPHVIAPEYYDVKVYDFFGNVIVSKKHADLRKLKADLPTNKFLIIQYWNDKIFKTEKIYKF